uniref:Uncharacterized protein n=1 Tax=Cannabis sativa TaxID=3483 RepID=A0A803QJE0_CANSA
MFEALRLLRDSEWFRLRAYLSDIQEDTRRAYCECRTPKRNANVYLGDEPRLPSDGYAFFDTGSDLAPRVRALSFTPFCQMVILGNYFQELKKDLNHHCYCNNCVHSKNSDQKDPLKRIHQTLTTKMGIPANTLSMSMIAKVSKRRGKTTMKSMLKIDIIRMGTTMSKNLQLFECLESYRRPKRNWPVKRSFPEDGKNDGSPPRQIWRSM